MAISAQQQDELVAAAAQARRSAYCPYSRYAVGAAVLDSHGDIHNGCNVENISYGLTVCAERNALAAAVLAGMQPGELAAVALVAGPVDTYAASSADNLQRLAEAAVNLDAGAGGTPTPCGACLQVLAEFAAPGCSVICASPDALEQMDVRPLSELLPRAFRG